VKLFYRKSQIYVYFFCVRFESEVVTMILFLVGLYSRILYAFYELWELCFKNLEFRIVVGKGEVIF